MIVEAPSDLSWSDQDLHRLTHYLARIRRGVLTLGRKVMVDLSSCRRLSSLACMMIAAEIQRCEQLKPGHINGIDPADRRARSMLMAMGFYDHLQYNRPQPASRPRQAIQIRSGLGDDETIAADAHEVSEVANAVLADATFAKRVHGALNEALGNVQMHAYAGADGRACLTGRWWIAGLANHDNGDLYFFALDHGVGIPATAPKSMGEALERHLQKILGPVFGKTPKDHQVLQAVVDERQTRTRKSQHGKGIASMINLIELAGDGMFQIFSGRGTYTYNRGSQTEPQAFSRPLGYTFPGTLIIWRVAGPTNGEARGDDDRSDQSGDGL